MASDKPIKSRLRALAFPAAASAVGGAIGLFLSRKPKQLRGALSEVPGVDVGGLKDELRGRLDSALGKDEPQTGDQTIELEDLEQRRQERRSRRERRRERLGA